jgi:murein DD-endopeptidase MepM/ murein hydrolase activator NlpD
MLRGRITLLVIPQEGGKTFEVKIPRAVVGLLALLGLVVVGLLALGGYTYNQSHRLAEKVVRLEREKVMLEEEAGQIQQLEQVLLRLQKNNRQLHAILGESVGLESTQESGLSPAHQELYISASARLRWGRINTLPTLWPVRGVIKREFSKDFPGVLISAPPRSLVRASGSGWVVRAGFDLKLGYVVELDHDSGITSLYGYNADLLAEVGDYVAKGQPIALSGRSGEAPYPALYYLVRENGEARSPRTYRLWL